MTSAEIMDTLAALRANGAWFDLWQLAIVTGGVELVKEIAEDLNANELATASVALQACFYEIRSRSEQRASQDPQKTHQRSERLRPTHPMTDRPWLDEPDELNGLFGDIVWILRRGSLLGNWCGYVAIPKDHPWHGLDGENIDVEIHGGITFSGTGLNTFPVLPGVWWVGFHCLYGDDLAPAMPEHLRNGMAALGATYKTIKFAQNEVEDLAAQVALILMDS